MSGRERVPRRANTSPAPLLPSPGGLAEGKRENARALAISAMRVIHGECSKKKRVSFNDRRWSGGGCRCCALPPLPPHPPAARSIEHERARLKNRLSATTFKFHRRGDDIFTRSGFVRALNQGLKTRARVRAASTNAIFIKMRKRPKGKYRLNSSSRAYGLPL